MLSVLQSFQPPSAVFGWCSPLEMGQAHSGPTVSYPEGMPGDRLWLRLRSMAFSSVSGIQNRLLLRIAGGKYQSFISLYRAWQGIVGDLLATKSHPFRFYQSVLYIAVQNNSWQQELFLRKNDILKQCRAKVGEEIKDIIFLIRS